MAKDNLFLGTARGKVGDIVFSRQGGQQIIRARNRNPRNPQTSLQLAQRVIMNTASKAYSLFWAICNHSFEGVTGNAANQRVFLKENITMLRDKIGKFLSNPTVPIEQSVDAAVGNFNLKDDVFAVPNKYLISQGTLPSIKYVVNGTAFTIYFGLDITLSGEAAVPTYAQVIEALGSQRGDQITIIAPFSDKSTLDPYLMNMQVARIILEPANNDLTTPFLTAATNGAINQPNEKNQGTVYMTLKTSQNAVTGLNVIGINNPDDPAPEGYLCEWGAVIRSRYENGKWRRSTQYLGLGSTSKDDITFAAAYLSLRKDDNSSLYLNQAQG